MKSANFTFNVLIEEVEGAHIAYCLEMGLVAVREDPNELPSTMCKLIGRQLEFALRNGNPSDIFHPAPPEIWRKFRRAEQEGAAEETTEKRMNIGDWPMIFAQKSYVACPA